MRRLNWIVWLGLIGIGGNGLYAQTEVVKTVDRIVAQVNDDIMVYGTYQEGFRGGGTTARPTARCPFR